MLLIYSYKILAKIDIFLKLRENDENQPPPAALPQQPPSEDNDAVSIIGSEMTVLVERS